MFLRQTRSATKVSQRGPTMVHQHKWVAWLLLDLALNRAMRGKAPIFAATEGNAAV